MAVSIHGKGFIPIISHEMEMSLSKLPELVMDREARHAAGRGVA